MALSRRLAAAAGRRVAVLVVEVPGWGLTRCAVEAAVRRRGWRQAGSPADADLLAVCGSPGDRLASAVDGAWARMPGPRTRLEVTAPGDVDATLDRGLAALLDGGRQGADARGRPPEAELGPPALPDDDTDDDTGDSGSGGDDDMSGTDDMDMDMGGMDMPMPGGVPLAGGDPDGPGADGPGADELDLDVLHVPLGPVLPAWPAGLVLHCTLAGEVVRAAWAEVLPAGAEPDPAGDLVPGSPPDRLDRAAAVLALAGMTDAAAGAARLRDDLLAGADPDDLRPGMDRLQRRSRGRLLRWALRDAPGVHARLLSDLAAARSPAPVVATPLDHVGALVAGHDLGAARLLVAAAGIAPALVLRSGADRGAP
ncbi:hypothetical protein ACI78R_08890 [Geodermatophilus sp. SYSU D01106]